MINNEADIAGIDLRLQGVESKIQQLESQSSQTNSQLTDDLERVERNLVTFKNEYRTTFKQWHPFMGQVPLQEPDKLYIGQGYVKAGDAKYYQVRGGGGGALVLGRNIWDWPAPGQTNAIPATYDAFSIDGTLYAANTLSNGDWAISMSVVVNFNSGFFDTPYGLSTAHPSLTLQELAQWEVLDHNGVCNELLGIATFTDGRWSNWRQRRFCDISVPVHKSFPNVDTTRNGTNIAGLITTKGLTTQWFTGRSVSTSVFAFAGEERTLFDYVAVNSQLIQLFNTFSAYNEFFVACWTDEPWRNA